jgi:imidazole glycerol-phosphate synthase subunit HisH
VNRNFQRVDFHCLLLTVSKAIEHVAPDAQVRVTDDPSVVRAADRVVFPGQGAMPDCMRELRGRGLYEAVIDAARDKPFLGICIGLQMLFEVSEEGDTPGLGVLPGRVRRFAHALADRHGQKLKVPHMGWNEVEQRIAHPLWAGIPANSRFYFVHSYYAEPAKAGLTAAVSHYPDAFACAAARENLFAVQFHPEKSAAAGLRLLANFTKWTPP